MFIPKLLTNTHGSWEREKPNEDGLESYANQLYPWKVGQQKTVYRFTRVQQHSLRNSETVLSDY